MILRKTLNTVLYFQRDVSKYGTSKIFNVPLSFVYKWCTDYRNDDPKIIGAPYTRHIVEKTKKRAVWIQHYAVNGVEMEGVRYVTLSAPDSWHMESVNEEADRVADYRLTPFGRNKTKLAIVVKARFKTFKPEPVSKMKESLSSDWDKYKAALEKDYSGQASIS